MFFSICYTIGESMNKECEEYNKKLYDEIYEIDLFEGYLTLKLNY